MKETVDKIITWVKSNIWIAAGVGIGLIILLFPKLLKFGANKRRRRRYATVRPIRYRRTKRVYTKGGKAKKAWQIKGSLAARRHMAKIRRKKAA